MKSFIPNRAMLHTHSFGVERNASSSQTSDATVIIDGEVVSISAMFVKPRYHNEASSLTDINLKPGDTVMVYSCELAWTKVSRTSTWELCAAHRLSALAHTPCHLKSLSLFTRPPSCGGVVQVNADLGLTLP